jgi:hypothetical protein
LKRGRLRRRKHDTSTRCSSRFLHRRFHDRSHRCFQARQTLQACADLLQLLVGERCASQSLCVGCIMMFNSLTQCSPSAQKECGKLSVRSAVSAVDTSCLCALSHPPTSPLLKNKDAGGGGVHVGGTRPCCCCNAFAAQPSKQARTNTQSLLWLFFSSFLHLVFQVRSLRSSLRIRSFPPSVVLTEVNFREVSHANVVQALRLRASPFDA